MPCTPRDGCELEARSPPSKSSKTVRSTILVGGPTCTVDRTDPSRAILSLTRPDKKLSSGIGTVSISLILVAGCPGPILRTSGLPASRQAMPRAIRRTKLRAPASVFSPLVRRARGLKRAQRASDQPSSRLVEAGTLGFPWLHTSSCQRSTRRHSSLRTSGRRRTRPCITASQSAHRTGPRLRRSLPGQALQDGQRSSGGTPVDLQHILHVVHKGGVGLRGDAPALFLPGLQRVFGSARRTVSGAIVSTTSRATSSAASSFSVQRARPGGGVEQASRTSLGHPVQLGRARLALQGRLHALQDQGLACPVHGHGGHGHGFRRAFVGPDRSLRPLVAEQPDLGPASGQRLGRAGGNQLLQVCSFLGVQFHQEALVGYGGSRRQGRTKIVVGTFTGGPPIHVAPCTLPKLAH